ncbi:MAG: hypothetical protein CMC51_03365 [Flavobacteriaceae bacterium]|nr:hypothetical protein [Flavobacteriaceae bacterium]
MKNFILIIILLFSFSCISTKNPIKIALNSKDKKIEKIKKNINEFELQIKLTIIDSSNNFNDYSFRVNSKKYFYPASTVKLPIALFSIEKINEIDEINLNTSFKIKDDTLTTTIREEIEKIFVISSNQSSNRLFEFLGQDYINLKLKAKGFKRARIFHRLSTANSENLISKKINFFLEDSIITLQNKNLKPRNLKLKKLKKGKAHVKNGVLINEPMDFSRKNYISITDLHEMIKILFFPKNFDKSKTFNISKKQLVFLKESMSKLPRDIGLDPKIYPDNYVKRFIYGDGKNILKNNIISIYNKTGSAYGHLTETALINLKYYSVILTATINVNSNKIYNDNLYDYKEIGIPFFAELSREIVKNID